MGHESVDVWSMADLATPFAVRTVATLGVADAVKDGPVPLDELARRCAAEADPLARLLRFLVYRGLFVEPEHDVFGPNDASRALESDDSEQLRAWLDLDGPTGRADLAFVELVNQVRGDHAAYPAAFGRTFQEDLAQDQQLADSFDGLMEAKAQNLAPVVARSYDWGKFNRIADVGGGKGVLLAEILREHPSLEGVLIDFPGPAQLADKYLRDRGMSQRATTISGNFFDALPVRVDACLLCDVLGDWNDEDAAWILTRCADAVGSEGRVLIVESIPSEPEGMVAFTELDLRMMVYVGGRMRDLDDTKRIAEDAGLAVSGATQINDHCIVECLPAM
jgi:2,7-dihydroxy-5-methyl-1-naphthoate 7-O-methyltransferase